MIPPASVRLESYYVTAGDTLASLAIDYAAQISGDPASTLLFFKAANPGLTARRYELEPGTYVQLPRLMSSARLVQRGAWLHGIAEQELVRHYGLPRDRLEVLLRANQQELSLLVEQVAGQIAAHNGIANPRRVYAGEVVLLPELELPALELLRAPPPLPRSRPPEPPILQPSRPPPLPSPARHEVGLALAPQAEVEVESDLDQVEVVVGEPILSLEFEISVEPPEHLSPPTRPARPSSLPRLPSLPHLSELPAEDEPLVRAFEDAVDAFDEDQPTSPWLDVPELNVGDQVPTAPWRVPASLQQ